MKGHLLRALVLTGVLILGFTPSLRTPFFMDDYLHLNLLAENRHSFESISFNTFSTKDISPSLLREILPWWVDPHFTFHYFRPIATLSLALDYILWGDNPQGYHCTSLLLHCLAAVLVYVLGLRLGLRNGYAFLGALISGLHFNHLFSVSWICNRDNTLGAIFLAASVLFYLTFLETTRRMKRSLYLVLSFLLFALGVFSKENLVLGPVVLFTIVVVRTGFFSKQWKGSWIPSDFVPLIPFFVFSIAYTGWYTWSGHGVSTGYLQVSSENSLAQNFAIIGRNLYLYLIALAFYWPPEFNPHALKWPWWVLWSLGLALPVGFVLWKRKAFQSLPGLWVALIWTLLFLLTPLWFVPVGRLLYMSTMGYGLLMAGLIQETSHSIRKRALKACLWGPVVFYFVFIPFSLESAGTALLEKKGDGLHLSLERAITEVEKELSADGVLFLINVPEPVSVYLAGAVHRFHSQGEGNRIFALGNVRQLPSLTAVGDRALRITHEDGIIELSVTFPLLTLAEGMEVRMPSFTVSVERTKGKIPTQVLFGFPKPLQSSDYAFLKWVEGKAERVTSFHSIEEGLE